MLPESLEINKRARASRATSSFRDVFPQAIERGLVYEIMTSDEYLSTKMKDFDVIEIRTLD